MNEFLNYLKDERNYSDKTILNYKMDLENFYNYINKKRLRKLISISYKNILKICLKKNIVLKVFKDI